MKYEFQSSMIVGENYNDRFPCARCGKSYLRKRHLQRHMRDECIGIPPRFTCELCPSRFRRKYHMVRHLTSKHGIPPPIAQQTTGGGGAGAAIGSGCGGIGQRHAGSGGDGSGCDSPIPENLSMRKEHYEHETKPTLLSGACGVDAHLRGIVGGITAAIGGGNNQIVNGVHGNNNSAGTTSNTPPPPAVLPTYGLTGAITAISTSAAAAAVASEETENLSIGGGGSGGISLRPEMLSSAADAVGGAVAIKNEPLTPNKAMSAALMEDEWKMKLSLQLISNSLLKERLMNSMPFAYNNN